MLGGKLEVFIQNKLKLFLSNVWCRLRCDMILERRFRPYNVQLHSDLV